MTTKTLGWGLIGTGKIADDRILPGINAFKGNQLVAVVSREQSRADAFAKKFGAPHAYTNYADMLATHLSSRADVTIAGIPVHAEAASALGIMRLDGQGRVEGFLDKPQTQKEPVCVSWPSWSPCRSGGGAGSTRPQWWDRCGG